MKKPYRIALAVAILAGAGTGAYFSGRRANQARESATLKSTTGTLSNISCKLESKSYGKNRSTVKVCSADVTYTAEGKQFTKNGFKWTLRNVGFLPPNDPKAGEQLIIYYEPATPHEIGIYKYSAGGWWLCLAVLVAVAGICIALAVLSMSDSPDVAAKTGLRKLREPVADYAPVRDYAPDEYATAPEVDPGPDYGTGPDYGAPAEYGSDEYFPESGEF